MHMHTRLIGYNMDLIKNQIMTFKIKKDNNIISNEKVYNIIIYTSLYR
jgi:hypothetical protein